MTSEKPEVIAALLKIKRKADYTDEELLVITINNLIKMGLLEIDRSRGAIRLTKNGREKLEKWLYGKKRVLDKHELAVLYGLHTAKEAYLDEPDFILGLCRLPEDGDKGFVDLLIEDLLENRLIAKVKVRRGRLLGVRYTLTEKGGKVVAKHEKEMLNARKLFENAVSTEEQEKIIKFLDLGHHDKYTGRSTEYQA